MRRVLAGTIAAATLIAGAAVAQDAPPAAGGMQRPPLTRADVPALGEIETFEGSATKKI